MKCTRWNLNVSVSYLFVTNNDNGRGRCCVEEIKKVIKPADW